MNGLPLSAALTATLASTIVIFATRALPFLLFSRREPPRIIRFVEKYIPPMVIALLIVYSLRDVRLSVNPWGIPHFAAAAFTAALHVWKRNSMISIFGGTALYMILIWAI